MDHTEAVGLRAVNQLDSSIWRGWQQRNRRRDERVAAARIVAVKCSCIAALAAAAILRGNASGFGFVLNAIVTVGAAVVACQAASMRRYGFLALFAFTAAFFNPFVALVTVSGDWQFGIPVAAIGLFACSLVWLKPPPEFYIAL